MFVSADKKPRQFKGHILIVVSCKAVFVNSFGKLSWFSFLVKVTSIGFSQRKCLWSSTGQYRLTSRLTSIF